MNPVQELSSGTPTANLLTGFAPDSYYTRTDATGARNFLTDALGSSVALTDSSGTVQTEYTYQPFGATTAGGGSTTNSFGFTGREADGTGLRYYRARYYDARLQRFIAEDPLGFSAGDANLHIYVRNAPLDLVDPTGEFAAVAVPIAAACIGGAIGRPLGMWLGGRKPEPRDMLYGCLQGIPFAFPALAPLHAVPVTPERRPNIPERTPYTPKERLPRDPRTGNAIPQSPLPHTQLGTEPGEHSGGPYKGR